MDTLNTSSSPLNFEEMYEQFHKLIYHIAYNITKDIQLSQDVVQESFLKAYIKLDTLKDPAKNEIMAHRDCKMHGHRHHPPAIKAQ